jgi:hypothetical protein
MGFRLGASEDVDHDAGSDVGLQLLGKWLVEDGG